MLRFTAVALVLTGCFPGMIGGGGGGTGPSDEPRKAATVKPALLEDYVQQVKGGTTRLGTIDRSLAAPDDLFITLRDPKEKRLSPMLALSGSTYASVRSLGFAGLVDGKLCFVFEDRGGKKGARKAERELREQIEQDAAAVYAVDELSKLTGPVWPPPSTASSLELEILSNELDSDDDRRITAQLCGAKPAVSERTQYIVVVQRSQLGEKLLADGHSTNKLSASSVFLWKLEGDKTATAATPEPRPGKPGAMSLAKSTVKHGASITVQFEAPLEALPGEKYWITIVDEAAGDIAYTSYKYLEPGARSIVLAAPATAGSYEVRLHANYPTKTYNLVQRAKLEVR